MDMAKKDDTFYDTQVSVDAFLKEYDDMLLGKRKSFSAVLLDRENESFICASMLRRIFEKYLHWTPVQIRDCLTPEIATRMCLWPFINRLECPPEILREEELCFVAWEIYPETKNVSEADLVRRVYRNLIEGKIQRFPKNYFDGYKGLLRAQLIFKTVFCEYLVSQYRLTTIESAYALFVSPEIYSIMERYKLTTLIRQKFDIPLNLLHAGLGYEASDVLYVKYLNECPASKWAYCRLTTEAVLAANGGVKPEKMIQYEKKTSAGSPYYSYYRERKNNPHYGETKYDSAGNPLKRRGRPRGKTDSQLIAEGKEKLSDLGSCVSLVHMPVEKKVRKES